MPEYTGRRFKQLWGSWGRKLGTKSIHINSRGENKGVQERESNHNVLHGSGMNTINTVIIIHTEYCSNQNYDGKMAGQEGQM